MCVSDREIHKVVQLVCDTGYSIEKGFERIRYCPLEWNAVFRHLQYTLHNPSSYKLLVSKQTVFYITATHTPHY